MNIDTIPAFPGNQTKIPPEKIYDLPGIDDLGQLIQPIILPTDLPSQTTAH